MLFCEDIRSQCHFYTLALKTADVKILILVAYYCINVASLAVSDMAMFQLEHTAIKSHWEEFAQVYDASQTYIMSY